jgi:diadenosine tetraphosphate (Ap4A) HIT family hydrolase
MCRRVAQRAENPHFIHELSRSILVVGDHQFHKGYCVLVLKDHVREMHDLPPSIARDVMDELMYATRAVVKAFEPWKINHSCYGNVVPHVHWHIFPRYESDPDHLNHPWLHAAKFKDHEIDPDTARAIAKQVRANL